MRRVWVVSVVQKKLFKELTTEKCGTAVLMLDEPAITLNDAVRVFRSLQESIPIQSEKRKLFTAIDE